MSTVIPLPLFVPCIREGEIVDKGLTRQGQVNIYRCEIHGRCTRQFVRNTLRLCGRCGDYKSSNVVEQCDKPEPDILASDSNGEANDSKPSGVLSDGRTPTLARLPIQPGERPADATPEPQTRGRRAARYAAPVRPARYVPAPDSYNRTHEQQRKQWKRPPIWAYGVTTVPQRRNDLLPRTLASLAQSKFDTPTLFVDGDWDYQSWKSQFNLDIVCRFPRIRTFGNWILSLAELYIRNPDVDYYAIFQDDFVASKNLREYLEALHYPEKGYWNLYTFPHNQILASGRKGFYKASSSWRGTGALGLVFNREAVQILLTHNHMVKKPVGLDTVRRHRHVDGGIVEAMNSVGWAEYVHNPSLVQHTGKISSTNNLPQPLAPSFSGEEFDLMTLLEDKKVNV